MLNAKYKTIAARHGVTAVTVRSWRRAFETDGANDWGKAAPGRGRKPSISPEKVAGIVELTTDTTPGHTLVVSHDG